MDVAAASASDFIGTSLVGVLEFALFEFCEGTPIRKKAERIFGRLGTARLGASSFIAIFKIR